MLASGVNCTACHVNEQTYELIDHRNQNIPFPYARPTYMLCSFIQRNISSTSNHQQWMAQDNKSFVFITISILLISISIKKIIHAMFQSESLMDDSFL